MLAVTACGSDSSEDSPEPSDAIPTGTYRMQVDADATRPGCVNGALDIELTVEDGSMTRYRIISGRRGSGHEFTFSVFRDQITIRDEARTLTATWSLDGSALSFDELDSERCEDLSDWTAGPFELVGQGAH